MRDLHSLSEILGLEFEAQDWGIINACGARLKEFIDFYQGTEGISRHQKLYLIDLILASANDALELDLDIDLKIFDAFIEDNYHVNLLEVDYWAGLEKVDEFPLGQHLRQSKWYMSKKSKK